MREHLLRETNIRNLTGTQLLIVIIDATWNVNACYYEVSYDASARSLRMRRYLDLPVNFINHKLKNTSAVSIPIDFKWEHRKNFADQSTRRFCKHRLCLFSREQNCGTYHPRAEDVKRRIRNDLTDACETLK